MSSSEVYSFSPSIPSLYTNPVRSRGTFSVGTYSTGSICESKESSSSIAALSDSCTVVFLAYCFILERYSSKLISTSSVSSSIESTNSSPFCFLRLFTTYISLFLIHFSARFSPWLLITWAEVSDNTLVYSFQVLNIDTNSLIFLFKRAYLDSNFFSSLNWAIFY